MVNYHNGKVYKIEPIVDHEEGDIYIGSTTKEYLSQRMDRHRSKYKLWKKTSTDKTCSFDLFEKYGIENCRILLLELVNAHTKDELHAREAHYIKTLKCVNKVIPNRTSKEYYEDKKTIISEKHKIYREANKEAILDQAKEYRIKNKDAITLRNKKYRESHFEELHEKKNMKTKCPCGGSYTHCHRALHFRTKKHIEYIKENEIKESNDPIDI